MKNLKSIVNSLLLSTFIVIVVSITGTENATLINTIPQNSPVECQAEYPDLDNGISNT